MDRQNKPQQGPQIQDFHLRTHKIIRPFVAGKGGTEYIVSKDNFPILDGIACHTLELWEECMCIPHWHANASELGYVISGMIEVIVWRSPGESAVFTLGPGMCWFIPRGAMHSVNNVGTERAKLLISFSSDRPQRMDMPVAYHSLPAPVRDAFTAPHIQLREWEGVKENPLLGYCPIQMAIRAVTTGSPYGFDFAKVTPLFNDTELGSVAWGVKNNWNSLEDISVQRAHLKSGVSRDPIWYPDSGALYVITKGKGEFRLVMTGQEPSVLEVEQYDYIFVPAGTLHTFSNTGKDDFEVVAFFSKASPQPEVSLSVATAFFPNTVRKAAMTQFVSEHKPGDPLRDMNYKDVSPYLLKVVKEKEGGVKTSPAHGYKSFAE